MKKTKMDWLLILFSLFCLSFVLLLLVAVVGPIIVRGLPILSLEFVLAKPSSDMISGGIGPAIYGTVVLTLLMTVAVIPFGIATAIYLAEFASPQSKLAAMLRLAVNNLAAVPSIVFGLFGLGFFVLFIGRHMDGVLGASTAVWGQPCVLWASLTLAVLTLPVLIVASEEALRAVPREYREAAFGLGATPIQTIFRVVLPSARAGVLTGVILAISRGAGEVAPIIFTGAANFLPQLPTDVRDMFMHLGYHVYALATQSPDVTRAEPTLYGTVLVLLLLTLCMNITAIVIRSRYRS